MTLLSVEGVSLSFGGVHALQNVDLELPEGVIWGLIGPNGAGKTTLINVISGLIRPTSGRISFDGKTGGPWRIGAAVGLGIVRTFQQTRAFLGLTVRENLRIAEIGAKHGSPVTGLVESLALGEVLDRVAGDLPYAVLRRLGIALALTLRPRLLLLDEPAVGLTGEEIERIGAIIRQSNAAGITVLLVEHNMRFLMSVAQRISVLDRGSMLFEGTPEECQAHPEVIDAYLGRRPSHAQD